MSLHIATAWPNARSMLRPTMLVYVAIVWPGLDMTPLVFVGGATFLLKRNY